MHQRPLRFAFGSHRLGNAEGAASSSYLTFARLLISGRLAPLPGLPRRSLNVRTWLDAAGPLSGNNRGKRTRGSWGGQRTSAGCILGILRTQHPEGSAPAAAASRSQRVRIHLHLSNAEPQPPNFTQISALPGDAKELSAPSPVATSGKLRDPVAYPPSLSSEVAAARPHIHEAIRRDELEPEREAVAIGCGWKRPPYSEEPLRPRWTVLMYT